MKQQGGGEGKPHLSWPFLDGGAKTAGRQLHPPRKSPHTKVTREHHWLLLLDPRGRWWGGVTTEGFPRGPAPTPPSHLGPASCPEPDGLCLSDSSRQPFQILPAEPVGPSCWDRPVLFPRYPAQCWGMGAWGGGPQGSQVLSSALGGPSGPLCWRRGHRSLRTYNCDVCPSTGRGRIWPLGHTGTSMTRMRLE